MQFFTNLFVSIHVYIYTSMLWAMFTVYTDVGDALYYKLYSIQYTSPCLLYMYEYVVSDVYSTQSYSR